MEELSKVIDDAKLEILSDFDEQDKKEIEQIKKGIDLKDAQGILEYGVSAQSEIAEFSNNILTKVKTKDSGYVGNALSDLMINVKSIKVDSLSKPNSFFNSLKRRIKKFINRYESVAGNIDKIVDELEKAKTTMFRDIEMLSQLYDKNIGYIKNLDKYIAAGDEFSDYMDNKLLPGMKQDLNLDDAIAVQSFNDLKDAAHRFDKKIHDLKLSRTVAIQSLPQIRLIQQNDQMLAEKIQSSLLNTIPLWKNQMVIAITIFRQRKALELQKEVSKTTNEMLLKNSELLKTGTIETAKESEKGIVEIETLRQVNADLIETITQSIAIQQEGRAARAEAEKELVSLEGQLKAALVESKK